jgi:hypothetical protein
LLLRTASEDQREQHHAVRQTLPIRLKKFVRRCATPSAISKELGHDHVLDAADRGLQLCAELEIGQTAKHLAGASRQGYHLDRNLRSLADAFAATITPSSSTPS